MDAWMDGWMDGWMGNGSLKRGWMDGCTNRWITDGWTDGPMDGYQWVDGWMDGSNEASGWMEWDGWNGCNGWRELTDGQTEVNRRTAWTLNNVQPRSGVSLATADGRVPIRCGKKRERK